MNEEQTRCRCAARAVSACYGTCHIQPAPWQHRPVALADSPSCSCIVCLDLAPSAVLDVCCRVRPRLDSFHLQGAQCTQSAGPHSLATPRHAAPECSMSCAEGQLLPSMGKDSNTAS